MRSTHTAALAAAATFALAGCTSTADTAADGSRTGSVLSHPDSSARSAQTDPAGNPPSSPPAAATTSGGGGGEATIMKVGFGQQDEYVWASALVRNDTHSAGQAVIVSFNLKDAHGRVLATDSQTSGFNWPDQQVPVATQISVPKHSKVTSVEATVVVEDNGIAKTSKAWGTFPATITRGEFGGWAATYHVKNPTSALIRSPALQEICLDAKGHIIGGTVEFPDLIPAGGEIAITSDTLYLNRKPSRCIGYLTPWF